MIQLFKKANSKAESENAGEGKQRWNADAVFVKVDNEMIPLSELAKLAKENEYTPVQSVENEMELDGSVHNVADLIKKYQAKKNADDNSDKGDEALQKAKKGMEKNKKNEEEDKDKEKENEVAGAKDNPDEAEKKAKQNADDAAEAKEKKAKDLLDEAEKEEKENEKDEEEQLEEQIKKQSKENSKDVKHFIRLNSARENGSADGGATLTIDTMHNRVDRGREKYGSGK